MNPLKRPKAGETQEDLLRQQAEFLAQGAKPAAIIVQKGDERPDPKSERPFRFAPVKKDVVKMEGLTSFAPSKRPSIMKKSPKSKQGPSRSEGMFRGQRVTFNVENDEDPEEVMDRHDTHITTVLSKIMERETSRAPVYFPGGTVKGFPTVPHRDDPSLNNKESATSVPAQPKRKKRSLFAQQFRSSTPSQFGLIEGSRVPQPDPPMSGDLRSAVKSASPSAGDSSTVVTGSGLGGQDNAQSIHEENQAKMAAMSEEEILQEQAKIKAMLDPSLLDFLQKRKGTSRGAVDEPANEETEQMETEDQAANQIEHDDAGDEVGVPIEVSKEWVHMDEVELDKLKWMKDLPKPSAKDSQGVQARFDFNGRLVAKEADVPVREGLHHHGDEPEVPGYSLEELFTLARSSVLNQRVLALQTLSRVIYNSRLQELGGELSEPLLVRLFEAGVLFLLRWSLDDSNEVVVSAAAEGVAALLVQPGDEDTLDRIYCWYHGNSVPPLVPHIDDDLDEEGQPVWERDLSDPQMVERDVIKALLRMNTLRRFCYIIDKVRPPAPTILNILAVLIRVARHSSQAAHEICKSPRLLEVIIQEFVPLTAWKQQQGTQVTDVYGYPVVSALKLVRVLCATGRNRAATLIAQFNLQTVLLRYISEEPTDMSLDVGSAFYVSIEAVRLWHTCIEYGLLTEMFSELYPILVQHLQLFQRLSILPLPATTPAADVTVHRLQLQRSATLLLLLEGVVQVAGVATSLHQQSTMQDAPPLPSIDWGHVAGLLDPISLCMRKWLHEMAQSTDVLAPQAVGLAASAINFVTSYYENAAKQPSYNIVTCLNQLEELTQQVLLPFLTSHRFHSILRNIRNHSESEDSAALLAIPALPDFGCHHDNQALVHPVVRRDSDHCFLLALLRLVQTVGSTHRGLSTKFFPIIVSQPVTNYLRVFCDASPGRFIGVRALFSRLQHLTVFYLLRVFQETNKQCKADHKTITLYHRSALLLFTKLQVADYYYAHHIFTNVLFDPDMLWEGEDYNVISAELSEKLRVTDPAGTSTTEGSSPLLQQAYRNIPEIRRLYMLYFLTDKKRLEIARAEALHLPHLRRSHLLSEMTGPLIPQDWIYLPLLQLFTELQKVEMHGKTVKAIPMDVVHGMTNALRWILILESSRPEVLSNIELAARIARLYCVFLISSDLFMEPAVKSLLRALLKIYTTPKNLGRLRFDVTIPGVSSFYDLFMELLSQYEAVSFGDQLFANYVLLPLQQRFSPRLKMALWLEKAEILHAFHLPITECLIPLDAFLSPTETDVGVLQAYLSAVASGAVIQQRAPFMYLIAIHHLCNFVFHRDHKAADRVTLLRRKIAKQLEVAQSSPIPKQTWRHHILYYKGPLAFELHGELPRERERALQELLAT